MSTTVGPYRILSTVAGVEVPWYVIPFDDRGRCKAPQTRAHLLEAVRTRGFTHVYLFSHGWNNDWADAAARYEDFVKGFSAMREARGVGAGAAYRPILVGVFWPSISLVLPWEKAPKFAGAGEGPTSAEADAFADEHDRSLSDIAAMFPPERVAQFYDLAGRERLDAKQAIELATLLMPLMSASDEGGSEPAGAEDMVAAWKAGAAEFDAADAIDIDEGEEFGTATPVAGAAPQAAGLLDALDPRHALRMATVWRMKDRAGTVGANGVHALLRDVLAVSKASLHMIGHSYGCKVVLSAIAAAALPRTVTSALLLQPAVSHLCFAVDADGKGTPGGYRVALERVQQPILSTFSSRDVPLSRIFHLAVRRKSDLGEQKIAGAPPSRFAALGGYGAGGLKQEEGANALVRAEGQPYPELALAGVRVVSLDGSQRIDGHGDVSQPVTWWMLCAQVSWG